MEGVIVTSKDGRQEFRAKVIVDATGDGDVAFLAGAEMAEGREEDGIHMPVSLVFALANVEIDRFLDFRAKDGKRFNEIIKEASGEGYRVAAWYSFDRTTIPGVLSVNNSAAVDIGNIDATKARDLTVAERMGIEVAIDFVKLAREKKIPGLENCFLMRVGACVGVRDTRRIVGEYILTVEDAHIGAEFEDTIARKYGAIDANQLFIGEMKSGFGYPYRCLLPKKIDNLLVAGRCGSATFLGHAAGKSMGNMMELGQATGVSAALCSAKGITPREIDVKEIQKVLTLMGVKI